MLFNIVITVLFYIVITAVDVRIRQFAQPPAIKWTLEWTLEKAFFFSAECSL